MSNETYLVGIAREDITPPVGIALAGYGVREGVSTGVDEPLSVTALVLEGEGGRVALVAIDWVLAHLPYAQAMRDACAQALGTSASNVLINFSHSHSTPPPPGWSPFDSPVQLRMQAEWADGVLAATARACRRAAEARQPARLATGWGECRANINRRQRTADGSVLLGEDPQAPTDHSVGVLRVDDLTGRPLAVAFRYSCHTVTLGPRTHVISPDFAGPARAVVEQGLDCPALFFQGCAGNQNPITGIGSDATGLEDTNRVGHMIGSEVLKVCATLRTHRRRCAPRLIRSVAVYWLYEYEPVPPGTPGAVRAGETSLTLPLVPFPPLAEVEKEAGEWRQRQAEAIRRGAPESERNLNQRFTCWAERRLAAAREGPNPLRVTFPVQVLRVGPLTVVGLPFEAMAETGNELRAASPAADTWVLGFCNGVVSYLPTLAISAEGGMEARLGYKSYLLQSEIPGDWEPRVRAAALSQIETLSPS